MESTIKDWIQIAGKLSRYLLHRQDTTLEQEVRDWQKSGKRQQQLFNELSRPDYYARQAKRREAINKKYSWEQFINSRQQKIQRRRIQIISYAATVILLLTAGGLLWHNNPQPAQTPLLTAHPQLNPGSQKASLILGDGKEIPLNNDLTLTEKNGTIIHNHKSGELAYQTGEATDTSLQYNILRVPRGGEYRLTLPDGTQVWINSESELRFPTRFSGNTREVFLKGEAYFEIAHNLQQPFYVHSQHIQVHATGTAFNVAAYNDETEMKITLVEGGVNIEENQQIISKLTPNDQFTLNKENGHYHIATVDPRAAAAWKNGSFFFDDEPLYSIIRKLSRWYNVDFECSKPEISHYKFSGEIRKYENAIQVLNMLKLTNEINYTIETNHKIIISPTE